MSVKPWMWFLLFALLAAIFAKSPYVTRSSTAESPPVTGSCTDGVNCYCDTVADSGHANYDPNVLMCEDFDAPSLYDYTGATEGDTSPGYGPWTDDGAGNQGTGCTGSRNTGTNSYWVQTYTAQSDGVKWASGDGYPLNPDIGCTCGLAECDGPSAWSPNDELGSNAHVGAIGGIRTGDFVNAAPSNSDPEGNCEGGSGHFCGNASIYFRIANGETAGILGNAQWTRTTEIGLTMAMGIPDRGLVTPGLLTDANWKFHEWGSNLDGAFFFGQSGHAAGGEFPFGSFTFANVTTATCQGWADGATVSRGKLSCPDDGGGNTNGIYWEPDLDGGETWYDRDTDHSGLGSDHSAGWPWGTWACLRAHYTGIGTSNTTIKQWIQGPNDTQEILVIDITGLDTSSTGMNSGGAGYQSMDWNIYANQNQDGAPTSEVSGRYEDNIHITNGTAVPCSQIGF